MNNNLLTALNKWASSQDENFITDAFAYLLRHLVETEPLVGIDLLRVLAGPQLEVTADEVQRLRVRTQITTDYGRPDMELRLPGHLIYVEVKVESQEGEQQLTRYADALSLYAEQGLQTQLIYLTRYAEGAKTLSSPSFRAVRWFHVATCLQQHLATSTELNSVSRHLVEQFVGFLQGRGIIMQQIQPDVSGGVRSLRSLLLMLEEAIASEQMKARRSLSFDYIGFDFDSKQFWIGVYIPKPESVVFETNEMDIDIEKATASDVGGDIMDHWNGKKKKWMNYLDISPENAEFFSLSQAQQMSRIEAFLRDSLKKAKQIEQSK